MKIVSRSRDGEANKYSQIDIPVRVSEYCRIGRVSAKTLFQTTHEMTHEIISTT